MRKNYLFCLALVTLLLVGGNIAQAQDSLGMHHVATLSYWSGADDIQMVGDLAYVMSDLSGLHIMNLADSSNPVEVGRYLRSLSVNYCGVYVTGNRAYLSLFDVGVVLDVSDPAHLVTLGEWHPPGSITQIFLVHENIAFAWGDEGVQYLLDVSDPTNVQFIGTFPDNVGPALGMAGEYLCMVGLPGGVVLYDFSDPTNPQQVAACDTTSQAGGAVLSGDYAYIATYYDGLHIIDLTNPLQPSLIAACDSGTWNVMVTGPHAVIITCEGLHIWNVVDPAHPVFEGAMEYPYYLYDPLIISSAGNLVCGRNLVGPKVAHVVDISNPATPTIVSEFGNYGIPQQLVISDTIGYIADFSSVGLRSINLADPNHISELSNLYGHSHQALSVAVRGNYAYEAVRYWRLFIVDVSNPEQLDSLWFLGMTPQNCNYLKVLTVGDYLYAFDFHSSGPSYIQTFDLVNPEIPELVNSLAIPQLSEGCAFGVTASNDYLYFVQYNYFRVYSLANPAAPQLVGSCGLPVPNLYARGRRVVVTGDYAYVANCGGGVVVVNIANPSSPTVVTSVQGYYSQVAVSQNVLFADDPHSAIYAMDISNPTNPIIIGYYSTYELIDDMDIQGQYLFTTSESDINVYQVDALTSVISPQGITPHEFKLYPCFPNPFNPITVIRFSLPHTGHVKLTVYEVTGRQVAVLSNSVLSAGDHRVNFDGSTLSSGVYFVRLEVEHRTLTEKLVLLR